RRDVDGHPPELSAESGRRAQRALPEWPALSRAAVRDPVGCGGGVGRELCQEGQTLNAIAWRLRSSLTSHAPFAGLVVRVTALLAWAEVVHGRRHGYRQPQGEIVAHVANVMDRPARYPHDVVLDRPDGDAPRQLPLEASGEHDPPLVELAVP